MYATLHWSTTSGTILQSEAVYDHKSADDANYWWNLRYEYEADGLTYTSSRYSISVPTGRSHRFSLRSSTHDFAEGNYRAGDTVIVRFDPQNKKMSVLDTGFSIWSIVLSTVGVTLSTAIGIIILRNLLKLRQPRL